MKNSDRMKGRERERVGCGEGVVNIHRVRGSLVPIPYLAASPWKHGSRGGGDEPRLGVPVHLVADSPSIR
jgi:hypothetical protein